MCDFVQLEWICICYRLLTTGVDLSILPIANNWSGSVYIIDCLQLKWICLYYRLLTTGVDLYILSIAYN